MRIPFVSALLCNRLMKTVSQIRIENLEILIEESGTISNLASKLGKSSAQVSQWKNASKDSKTGKPRGMRDTTCRDIEVILGKPQGWMDREHSKDEAKKEKSLEAEDYNREEFDEFTKQLLYFFNGMSLDHKDAVLLLANKLYAMDNSDDRLASPFSSPMKSVKTRKKPSGAKQ
jgi:hypothetical protein